MSQKTPPISAPSQPNRIGHWIFIRVQLVLRLLFDSRVKPLFKLFPILGIFLLFAPLLGGILGRVGAFLLAMVLFVEASPPKVVREHLEDMYRPIGEKSVDPTADQDVIIDAEFHEIKDETKTTKK